MDVASIPWVELAPFILIGFSAQLVDSTLGMAFGFLTNALLMMLGWPPLLASATTHTVESFTSGVSGLGHAMQRNIDWPLFSRLVIPGVVGGLVGVWVTMVLNSDFARPIMLVYMAAIGAYLAWRAVRRAQTYRPIKFVGSLGFVGGFVDASGGGGWGPVVTGSLLAQGMTPRMAIGTANAAEFFVTVTVLAAFIGSLAFQSFTLAGSGILLGGIIGALLGPFLTRRVAPRRLVRLVGLVLMMISLAGLFWLMFEPVPAFPGF
jgi:uncharacterized membrane protein YfcA